MYSVPAMVAPVVPTARTVCEPDPRATLPCWSATAPVPRARALTAEECALLPIAIESWPVAKVPPVAATLPIAMEWVGLAPFMSFRPSLPPLTNNS
ncbi:hypothetical protein D3C81_1732030 [compost metagenome]